MGDHEYTFPFDTCETPREHGVAQPYSALFNLVNCAIILYFLCKTTQLPTFVLLLSIGCFELFHLFSHIVHITGPIQINITHSLTYWMNLSFFYVFYSYTRQLPDMTFLLYLLAIVCFDIYAFLRLSIVYYLSSQSILFVSMLMYYFPLLPNHVQTSIYYITLLVGLIIVLFLNEKYNCRRMLEWFPQFPWHVLIETVGIVLFYVICSHFYDLHLPIGGHTTNPNSSSSRSVNFDLDLCSK